MNPISIVFAGDFCAIHPNRLKMGTRLARILQSADLRCINFEGPLQRGKVESANGMYLAQSDDSPKWIKENGFNLVALANNHACDFGADGLIASRDAFQNLYTVGCGDGWDEAYKVKYIGIKDKVIGLLNVTSADFSSLKDEWTDAKLFGCPWVNHPSIPQILIEARKQCNYLIVLPHAGVEFMDVPLGGKILVNDTPAKSETKIYENFTLSWDTNSEMTYADLEEETEEHKAVPEEPEELKQEAEQNPEPEADAVEQEAIVGSATMTVVVNRLPVVLRGKNSYVFVDVFSFIDFDLKASGGRSIVTKLNGRKAEYMEPLKDGDVIEIYWE